MSHASHGHGSTEGILAAMPAEAPAPGWNARTPAEILGAFDYGKVSTLAGGRVLREYTMLAEEKMVEVAKGVEYPAWTYNGTVPGPTLRCTEGDRLKIYFQNMTAHPH